MKKLLAILMVLSLSFTFASASSVNEILEAAAPSATEEPQATKPPVRIEAKEPYTIDVDLTKLSSTMVFGEVYNMLANSKDYVGKTIKMGGAYSSNFFDLTQKNYHYVVISDATACCQNGIEFVFDESLKYPEDYPKIGNYVEVVGVFDIYEELQTRYPYLKAVEIKEYPPLQ